MNKHKQQYTRVADAHAKTLLSHKTVGTIPAKHALSPKFALIIVFCVPVLLYLQTLSFKFTCFDDNFIIVNNKAFLSDSKNLPQAFLTDAFIEKISPFYRPLQTVSYIIDEHISSGVTPWMFHLSNILLLGFIAMALYLLLKRFLVPPTLALLGTLLYCVHPLFVSSVAWIPARGDLLLLLFALLSFLFLIDYVHKGRAVYWLLHVATFTLALFSKETAAVLPVLFVVYYLCFATQKHLETKHILLLAAYAIIGLLWFWIRSIAVGNYTNQSGQFGFSAIISNVPTIAESLSQFIMPFPIAPIPGFTVFKTLSGLAILVGITFLIVMHKETMRKETIFYGIWFILFMLPPMFYQHPDIDYLDHRFFLPLIALLLFLLRIFPKQWLIHGDIKQKWIMIVGITILGSLSFINTRSYANESIFYSTAVKLNEHSALALYDRGLTKKNSNDKLGAIDDFNRAIALNDTYTDAYYSRGSAKAAIGDNQAAIADYNKALALKPNYAEVYYNRGIAKAALLDFKAAIDDYDKAISFRPNYVEALNNRGIAKSNTDDNRAAIDDFTKALALNPNFAEAYNNRATTKEKIRDNAGALDDFNKALAVNPNFAEVYYNRGVIYFNLRNYKQSVNDFTAAISLRPIYAEAYGNKGLALMSTGNFNDAIVNFTKAIEQNPNYIDAYYNRAFAKYSLKDYVGTIQDCDKVLQVVPTNQNPLNLKAKAQQELQKGNQ